MMDSKLAYLLEKLSSGEYVPSRKLAEECGISGRTVQTRMRELKTELLHHGAAIESRQRYGYRLLIKDAEQYEAWRKQEQQRMKKAVPNSAPERFRYILIRFFKSSSYVSLSELSEELCVSEKTLSTELKQIKFVLGKYDLAVKQMPHYGMRVDGSEFNIRKCCMDYVIQTGCGKKDEEDFRESLAHKIGDVLLDVMLHQKVNFSEIAFHNVVQYLCITSMRNQAGFVIQDEPALPDCAMESSEYMIAKNLAGQLRKTGVEISEIPAEYMYIAVYIAGCRIMGEEYKLQSNLIMGDEYKIQSNLIMGESIQRPSALLLDCIQRVYNLNFRENLNVRIALYNHLMTFHIRMTYGIPMPNPILNEIKQNYPFAFAMAQRAMVELEGYYDRKIPENETGYFAIILEMALESLKENIEKKNILLVCMTGKASSRLLLFRFQNEFGVYINQLSVCSMYEFEQFDLDSIDYVFTTVPLYTERMIPIYQISTFLDANDVPQVRRKLEQGSVDVLKTYYKKGLFFPHISGTTREEVIRELCHGMAQAYPIPEERFCDSVLSREQMGSTDFGNLAAIPHPEECFVKENIACVGILDKPVLWSAHMVQLVIMVAIYESVSAQVQTFYKLTSELLSDPVRVKKILDCRNYEFFIELLVE